MRLNQAKQGYHGLQKLDTTERPVFGFGNSSSDRCLSTAWLQVSAGGKSGEMKIHTLDRGDGPILLSVQTLRSLKAVLDFENDLVVFRAIDPQTVIETRTL